MFDRAAIMRRAWEIYRTVRFECDRRALSTGFIPARFANALRGAWADAKSSIAKPHTADQIRARIHEIECSADFVAKANRAELYSLRDEPTAFSRDTEAAEAAKITRVAEDIRAAILARLRKMREGRTGGLTRENWKELGALRDKLRSDLSASV